MSVDLAARGRIGRMPDVRETKTGKTMTLTSMAVDVTAYNADDQQTLWLGLVAFGQVAERLAKVRQGDTVSVHGAFTQKPYQAKDGTEKPGFSLRVESLISHRPKVGTKRSKPDSDYDSERPDELNDSIPF